MAKRKRIELPFEGSPLVVTKLSQRENHPNPLREVLLSNGRSIRLVAVSEPNYPGNYTVAIHASKGARTVIINSRVSLELSGLDHGAVAVVSVDPESGELLIERNQSA